MIVTLEPTAFLARVHDDAAVHGPMPWDYVGVVSSIVFDERRVATLKGLVMPGYNREARDAILAKLASIGATEAQWARKGEGADRIVRVRLSGDGRVIYL